jgi:hypothetical protein
MTPPLLPIDKGEIAEFGGQLVQKTDRACPEFGDVIHLPGVEVEAHQTLVRLDIEEPTG